jgi:hypothetical protein
MTMAKATAKNGVVRFGLLVLVLVLVLIPPILLGGCSNTKVTTTTTGATTTTSTTILETTTSTTEGTTTTTGIPGETAVSHQENDPRFVYAGKWTIASATAASGKSLAVANKSGCSVTIRFHGTNISWIAKVSPAYGQAKVTVDGGAAKTVDLYSKTTVWKKTVWKSDTLASGAHTVAIAWTGKKSAAATGTSINIDAIVVTGVVTGLYQQDNAKLAYSGTWNKTTASAASNGSFVSSDQPGASVTVQFVGTDLAWIARTGPSYGQASVTVDGGLAVTVDLYSAAIKSQKQVWASGALAMGTHTIQIVRLGTKNAASKGTAINVDAFDVTGSLK